MRLSPLAFFASLVSFGSLLALSCGSGDDLVFTSSSATGTGGVGVGGAGTAGDTPSASASSGAGAAGMGGMGAAGGTSSTGSTSSTGGTGAGNNGFPMHWPDGLDCANEPEVTVWEYDDDTFILRQSLCTNFEGPFMYLLFGDDKVLMQDTGTGSADVAGAVSGVITSWLAKKGKPSIDLVVTHSHSHGDHVGGDGQFAGMPNTTVVGTSTQAVQTFFGIQSWPTQLVTYDLGGRVIDVIPIPGHQNAHIALYDAKTQLLFTGDTLYPGRLYVSNWTAYGQSTQRLVDFTAAPGHPVAWVLGTHIEMTTAPGDDFAFGADQHPNEHVLQLPLGALIELNQGVIGLGNNPAIEVHDDFIIYPL